MQLKKAIAIGGAVIFAGAAGLLAVRALDSDVDPASIPIPEPVPAVADASPAPAQAPQVSAPQQAPAPVSEDLARELTELKLKAASATDEWQRRLASSEEERAKLASELSALREDPKVREAAKPARTANSAPRLTPEVVTP